MNVPRLAFLLQLGSTLPLVGLIWLVQIVAYPLFARVGAAEFVRYHEAHARLITFVVGPLMVCELGASILGVVRPIAAMPRNAAIAGVVLVLLTWIATMFVSVPEHDALAHGFDARAHELLVLTNWLRTAAWTARGALLLWVVRRALD